MNFNMFNGGSSVGTYSLSGNDSNMGGNQQMDFDFEPIPIGQNNYIQVVPSIYNLPQDLKVHCNDYICALSETPALSAVGEDFEPLNCWDEGPSQWQSQQQFHMDQSDNSGSSQQKQRPTGVDTFMGGYNTNGMPFQVSHAMSQTSSNFSLQGQGGSMSGGYGAGLPMNQYGHNFS
eukprot:Nitzschia sp. Nitz4//scaffold103_size77763//59570//60097//NITZ4_005450-RA/size77763-processed-gene-0.30-mRNA-1//-1//CDS//3329532343//7223//frame0